MLPSSISGIRSFIKNIDVFLTLLETTKSKVKGCKTGKVFLAVASHDENWEVKEHILMGERKPEAGKFTFITTYSHKDKPIPVVVT
jgi:hypothetical protein